VEKGDRKRVVVWARDIGVEIGDDSLALLDAHITTLWEWNRRTNLTGVSSKEEAVEELLMDSLAAVPFFPHQGRYLDAGSGGGFPAIPVKVCRPALETHLVESVRKKVSFLREVIRITNLKGISVIHGRVEDLPMPLSLAGYDRVTARAVAKLPQAIVWCGPLVAEGGILLCFQGRDSEQGLAESQKAMEENGLFVETVFSYKLPGKAFERHLLVLRRSIR